jgi:hypothetical protein
LFVRSDELHETTAAAELVDEPDLWFLDETDLSSV